VIVNVLIIVFTIEFLGAYLMDKEATIINFGQQMLNQRMDGSNQRAARIQMDIFLIVTVLKSMFLVKLIVLMTLASVTIPVANVFSIQFVFPQQLFLEQPLLLHLALKQSAHSIMKEKYVVTMVSVIVEAVFALMTLPNPTLEMTAVKSMFLQDAKTLLIVTLVN